MVFAAAMRIVRVRSLGMRHIYRTVTGGSCLLGNGSVGSKEGEVF